MNFVNLDTYIGKLFWGNILLMVCSSFYLAWWIKAFKPKDASKGLGTILLLLTAIVAGIVALIFMEKGISATPHTATLFPAHSIIWGGIAAYFILFVLTYFLFKRQVTTELLLIVGWAMLELSAIDVLYGAGRFMFKTAVILSVIIAIAGLISLICYVLYYSLGKNSSYIDGMIPLIADAIVMACIAVATVV